VGKRHKILARFIDITSGIQSAFVISQRDTVDVSVKLSGSWGGRLFLKSYRTESFLQLVRLYLQPDNSSNRQLSLAI
jgi:hypothetical protein